MPLVRCITLTQPYASLVVRGLKQYETRGYRIMSPEILQQIKIYGLYIHAGLAKHVNIDGKKVNCRELCEQPFFKEAIGGAAGYDKLPFGGIIGKVNYNGDWFHTDILKSALNTAIIDDRKTGSIVITQQEQVFGDYSKGRFAWKLHKPSRLVELIPCKGKLQVWEYEL